MLNRRSVQTGAIEAAGLKGPLRLAVNLVGLAMSVWGTFKYWRSTDEFFYQLFKFTNPITSTVEDFITYASSPFGLAVIVVNSQEGNYN